MFCGDYFIKTGGQKIIMYRKLHLQSHESATKKCTKSSGPVLEPWPGSYM